MLLQQDCLEVRAKLPALRVCCGVSEGLASSQPVTELWVRRRREAQRRVRGEQEEGEEEAKEEALMSWGRWNSPEWILLIILSPGDCLRMHRSSFPLRSKDTSWHFQKAPVNKSKREKEIVTEKHRYYSKVRFRKDGFLILPWWYSHPVPQCNFTSKRADLMGQVPSCSGHHPLDLRMAPSSWFSPTQFWFSTWGVHLMYTN